MSFLTAAGIALAAERPTGGAKAVVKRPVHPDLQLLQGTWEGELMGDKAHQKITITIARDSLHFHRDAKFWFATTITLLADTDPKQLHATIKDRAPSQGVSIGQVVKAFFKIKDGTLTLATIGDDAEETPESFAAAGTRYEFRKVFPKEKKAKPAK